MREKAYLLLIILLLSCSQSFDKDLASSLSVKAIELSNVEGRVTFALNFEEVNTYNVYTFTMANSMDGSAKALRANVDSTTGQYISDDLSLVTVNNGYYNLSVWSPAILHLINKSSIRIAHGDLFSMGFQKNIKLLSEDNLLLLPNLEPYVCKISTHIYLSDINNIEIGYLSMNGFPKYIDINILDGSSTISQQSSGSFNLKEKLSNPYFIPSSERIITVEGGVYMNGSLIEIHQAINFPETKRGFHYPVHLYFTPTGSTIQFHLNIYQIPWNFYHWDSTDSESYLILKTTWDEYYIPDQIG